MILILCTLISLTFSCNHAMPTSSSSSSPGSMFKNLKPNSLLASLKTALHNLEEREEENNVLLQNEIDLTEKCCTVQEYRKNNDLAILADRSDRTLVRLYKTKAYNQQIVENYCMSLADTNLAVTVDPMCAGQCKQVKEAQEAIVVDERGRRSIRRVLVNAGCAFVPDFFFD